MMRSLNKPGYSPNMNSEFYVGWMTYWGEEHYDQRSSKDAVDLLAKMDNFNL